MPLSAGTRFGNYEIVSAIGAGGMGEVYRARDTSLKRDVAVKILPESFAADPERLARFQREAEALASLNHPNIAAIYGLAEGNGIKALVMELVDGEDLADRIAHGPIPVDEALPIVRQVAEALEAAHEQGIIHRDLKPANIKVRTDGTAKVVDFGLAKVLEPLSGVDTYATSSPTITSPAMTRIGVILGTAAYMSPEQAKGKSADQRSDIWAFGCVLYEMLAGTRAFGGEDVSDTLASVLRDDPEWTALPSAVSPAIVALIRGCLTKDPRHRIGDISTARFIFDHGMNIAASEPGHALSILRRTAPILIASAATAVIAAYVTWMFKSVPAPLLPLARFTISLAAGDQFTNTGVPVVALSPDGSHLVYVANQRLYMRTMDQLEATPIRGTEVVGVKRSGRNDSAAAAARQPFFSPDGQWIGFWQDGQLKKVAITGGVPVVLCAVEENPWGASWTTDNTILFGQGREGSAGVWRVSGDGGKPEQLVKVETDQIALRPQLLPGGRAILFTLFHRADWEKTAQVVVYSLDTGTRRVVLQLQQGAETWYVPSGHLVYALEGTLLAVPFDVSALHVTGGPVPIIENVAQSATTAHFAFSKPFTLAYVPSDAISPIRRQHTLVWVNRQGREDPIKGAAPRHYIYPRLSPNGTRVAIEVRENQSDIWILDLARDTLTRLTGEPTFDQSAVWTHDARSVIYSSSQVGGPFAPRTLFRRSADGTGTVEPLTDSAVAQFASAVTPDDDAVILRQQTPAKSGAAAQQDLFLLPLRGERRSRPLLPQTPFDELNGEVSPDGRWLAYQSNESGRHEIYVRPFPNLEAGRWQVSANGGAQPLWAPNGHELFYVSMGALMRVSLKITGSAFELGLPTKLFDGPYVFTPPEGGQGRMYDVSPDQQRFLMIKQATKADEPTPSPRIIVVQNWLEELKRRVPTK